MEQSSPSQVPPKKFKRPIIIGTAAFLIIVLVAMTIIIGTRKPTEQRSDRPLQKSSEETNFQTLQPILISGSSSTILLGTVISNETANIYPRRDGIVEDVLVDIGDTVQKGQVVARLLPKGVEGQSAAAIAEKQARKVQAESDYSNAQFVAAESIANAQQRVDEAEAQYEIALRKQESLLEQFAQSEENVYQKREQAFAHVQNARRLMEWILLGSNDRSDNAIQENDIQRTLGLLDGNPDLRYAVIPPLNALNNAETQYRTSDHKGRKEWIDVLFQSSFEGLDATQRILQATPSVTATKRLDQYSQADLTERIQKIITAQNDLYQAKERYDDASREFGELRAEEPSIYEAYRTNTIGNAQSNAVSLSQEQLSTAQNMLTLTEASQKQTIERQQTMVTIADTMLRSEYTQSGHREIRSPFSGVVSKRFINVGAIIMSSKPAFELTGVETSLAKKARAEIQFGLPEELIGALDTEDPVTFFLQTDESQIFEATVTRISPQVDIQTQTISIKAKIPDDVSLPHQASVRVRITNEEAPVYQLPSSSVKRDEGSNYIWILGEDNHPSKQSITVIAEDGEFAEVTGDITAMTSIILNPPDTFDDQ